MWGGWEWGDGRAGKDKLIMGTLSLERWGFLYYVFFFSKSLSITYINYLLGTKGLKLSWNPCVHSVDSEMKDGLSHAHKQEAF